MNEHRAHVSRSSMFNFRRKKKTPTPTPTPSNNERVETNDGEKDTVLKATSSVLGNELLFYKKGDKLLSKQIVCKDLKKYVPEKIFAVHRDGVNLPTYLHYCREDYTEVFTISASSQNLLEVVNSVTHKEVKKVIPNLKGITDICVKAESNPKGVDFFFLNTNINRKLQVLDNVNNSFLINKGFKVTNLTSVFLMQNCSTKKGLHSTFLRQLKYFPYLKTFTRRVEAEPIDTLSVSTTFECKDAVKDNLLQLLGLDWKGIVSVEYLFLVDDEALVKYIFYGLLKVKQTKLFSCSSYALFEDKLLNRTWVT